MAEQSTAVQRTLEPNALNIVKHETLVDRINSIFNDISRRAYQIFEGDGSRHGHDVEDWLKAEREMLSPVNIEMTETDQAVAIKASVGNFNEKELQISVEPRQLTITGKHEASKEEKKGETVYSETIASDILNVVALPADVDAAKASATLRNGMLTLTLPKATKAPSTRIQPKAA